MRFISSTSFSFCQQRIISRKPALLAANTFSFIPPTGNRISYEAVHIHTIGEDGKIAEHKSIRDDLKFMLQLGVIKPVSEFEPYIKGWKGVG